jgi:hypothetical protein
MRIAWWQHALAVVGLGLASFLLSAAVALAQTYAPTPSVPSATPLPPSTEDAVNLRLTVAVLLDDSKGGTNADLSALARCGSVGEAAGVLAAGSRNPAPKKKDTRKDAPGGLRTLCYSTKDVCLEAVSTAAFVAEESRPVFVRDAEADASPTNKIYGVRLHVAARLLPAPSTPNPAAATAGRSRQLEIGWQGAYAWSQNLISAWERVALRAFKAASKVPGITYQSDVEDEDGFLNSREGIDVGGLFGKKRKKAAPEEAPQPQAATGEPSYLGDTARMEVVLSGRRQLADGELFVERLPSVRPDGKVDTLYFILQARLR